MSTIVTRTGKGTPLTTAELDANFTNLNFDKMQETIANVAPVATDDSSLGHVIGNQWYDTVLGVMYKCISTTVGAAVWKPIPFATDNKPATEVTLDSVTGTSHTVQDAIQYAGSAGVYKATNIDGLISKNATSGLIDVAGFSIYFRISASDMVSLKAADILNVTGLITNIVGKWIVYADYNGGTPQISVSQTLTLANGLDKIILGYVYYDGTNIHSIVNAPQKVNGISHLIGEKDYESVGITHGTGDEITTTSGLTFALAAGAYWLRMTRFNVLASTSTLVKYFYHTKTAGAWDGIAGIPGPPAMAVLTEYITSNATATLPTGTYGVIWIYRGIYDGDIRAVPGGFSVATLNLAEALDEPTDLPGMISTSDAYVLTGRIIVQEGNANIVAIHSVHGKVIPRPFSQITGGDITDSTIPFNKLNATAVETSADTLSATDIAVPTSKAVQNYVDNSSPVGMITAWNPGYFTDGVNGGFAAVLSANDVLAANGYLNPKGWYVCDGALLTLPNSPIFNGPGRHLPNLTDERFLVGSLGAGVAGGSNTLKDHKHANNLYTHDNSHSHPFSTGAFVRPSAWSGGTYNNITWDAVSLGVVSSASAAVSGVTNWATFNTSIYGEVGTPAAPDVTTGIDNRPKYLDCFYIIKVI